jgi:gamma-glutamyltranspeptidase/glutathione hydrolase/leukotriene-C4 hydrolase
MAVGVPGELKGYWEAHQKYGKLPWEQVVKPTIKICEEGYIMTKHQEDSLLVSAKLARKDPVLRSQNTDINIMNSKGPVILINQLEP